MDHSYLHDKKILLVDDEPELLKMVAAILKDDGFGNIAVAGTVKDGIAKAKVQSPDLAILDVMLPDGDGFSLMRQMRSWTDVPVIFLTARDETPDKLAGLGLGADDYIVKPFLPQEFLLRVYAVLRRCYKEDAPLLKLESCTVDFSRAEVNKDGETLPLTAMEAGPKNIVAGALSNTVIVKPFSTDKISFLSVIEIHNVATLGKIKQTYSCVLS